MKRFILCIPILICLSCAPSSKGVRVTLDCPMETPGLHVVYFVPGSGWIMWDTRDGITPIVNLNNVTAQDIDRFNKFYSTPDYRLTLNSDCLQVVPQ